MGVEVFLQVVLYVQKCRGLFIPSTNFNFLDLLLVLNRTHFKNLKKNPPELNTCTYAYCFRLLTILTLFGYHAFVYMT